LAHPLNSALLAFLKIDPNVGTHYFAAWDESSISAAYDEGGRIFFDYASQLPSNTKCTLQIVNVLVNPDSGVVFAVHYGRCTFFHRCDFGRTGVVNSDQLRIACTLDGDIDITPLGADWAILNGFVDDEDEQLFWSYELSRALGDPSVA